MAKGWDEAWGGQAVGVGTASYRRGYGRQAHIGCHRVEQRNRLLEKARVLRRRRRRHGEERLSSATGAAPRLYGASEASSTAKRLPAGTRGSARRSEPKLSKGTCFRLSSGSRFPHRGSRKGQGCSMAKSVDGQQQGERCDPRNEEKGARRGMEAQGGGVRALWRNRWYKRSWPVQMMQTGTRLYE